MSGSGLPRFTMSQKVLDVVQEIKKTDEYNGEMMRHLIDVLEYRLKNPNEPVVYSCDGCNEDIDGSRMHCRQCMFFFLR
jgi:putative IMPACT (imprinted ancient) family translation regulator